MRALRRAMWIAGMIAAGCGDGKLFAAVSPPGDTGALDAAATGQVAMPSETEDRDTQSPTGSSSLDTAGTAVETGTAAETGEETDTADTGDTADTTPQVVSVAVEAEDFDTARADPTGTWQWVRIDETAAADSDPSGATDGTDTTPSWSDIVADASGHACLAVLPNRGQLQYDPSVGPMVGYAVTLPVPGRYYVWVRGYSTGGTDNTAHVGIDDTWPASGKNLQMSPPAYAWQWTSNKRNSGGDVYGIPNTIYLDVAESGAHTVWISMREDGFVFDRFVLTTDAQYIPP